MRTQSTHTFFRSLSSLLAAFCFVACTAGGVSDAGHDAGPEEEEPHPNDVTGTFLVTVSDESGVVLCTHGIVSPDAPKLVGFMGLASDDADTAFALTVGTKETADPPWGSAYQVSMRFQGRVEEPRDADVVTRTHVEITELTALGDCQSAVGAVEALNVVTSRELTSSMALELSRFVGPSRVTSETCPNTEVSSPCSSTEGHARSIGNHAFAFEGGTAVVEWDIVAPIIWVVSEP
jgi:hypothetical protein